MPIDIVMPRLSDTMSEGTIARWLKKPGDAVKKGETLAEIETDKALMEYESFEDGTLGEIKVGDGQTAPLGETIAVLYRPGETPSAGAGDRGPGAGGLAGRAAGGDIEGAGKPNRDAHEARGEPHEGRPEATSSRNASIARVISPRRSAYRLANFG